jgi:hypothetical protein
MRRILTGFAATALMAVVPTLVLAGNQEMADQIAQRLRSSGQLNGYKIGIKCQDGTAWVRGRVTSEEQLNTALKLTFQTPGVTRTQAASHSGSEGSVVNPLRGLTNRTPKDGLVKRLESAVGRGSEQADHAEQVDRQADHADRVSDSYPSSPAMRTSAEETKEEMPRQMMMPSRAKPMANQRVAMQPNTRGPAAYSNNRPVPTYTAAAGGGVAPARYDQACMPNYAWPSYAAYPNYAAVTYPKQYSATAWPYIGPFYPYPQVPMGWRKVTLEWDDGWWFLDFKDQPASCWHR